MENPKEYLDIFARLRQGKETLTSSQALLCNFILQNYRNVAFMTVEKLAASSGVSTATVIRTIKKLGFGSYNDFLETLRKVVLSSGPSLWWQMEETWNKLNFTAGNILQEVAKDNIESITNSISPMLMENFPRAVQSLCSAERIYIVGLRSTQGIALYCYLMLNQFLDNISFPCMVGSDNMYSELYPCSEKDALIAISIGGPHYATRTIDALEYASSKGATTILVTTDVASPGSQWSSVILPAAPSKGFYSVVSVMTIIDALIATIGYEKKIPGKDKLRNLEKILVSKGITY